MHLLPVRLTAAVAATAAASLAVAALAHGQDAPPASTMEGLFGVHETADAAGHTISTKTVSYTATGTQTVTPVPQPAHTGSPVVQVAGTSRALPPYAFMVKDSLGRPAHWNRCRVVNYRINAAGAPAGAVSELKTALAKLAAVSGITFKYAGTTAVVPYTNGWTRGITANSSILFIAWSDERKVPDLRGTVAGVAGPLYVPVSRRESRIVAAGVTFDRAVRAKAGFGEGVSRGTLMLHELGHAVNLAHVSDRYQTMYPTVTSVSRGSYQRGDAAGLAKLKSYACF